MSNKHMKRTFLPTISLPVLAALAPLSASAMCPVCTVAAAGGVELSRMLGIDDAITGLWLGGLTVSLILWTESWLDKKVFHRKGKEFTLRFKGRLLANTLLYLLLIIVPLWSMGVIGQPGGALHFYGIDRLLLGAAVGASAFWFGGTLYEEMKAGNGGHAHFPFEKVVMPIAPLLLVSVIFYFLTK
jgi:hypothetical protein